MKWRYATEAGGVDERVEATEMVNRVVNHALALRVVADVAAERGDTEQVLEEVDSAGSRDDGRASLREL
jgi:hypothetical protein